MLQSFLNFASAAHRKTREEFLAAFPEPVFVVEPFGAVDTGNKFQTVTGAVSMGESTSVAPIKKREGANAFGMMITIGRAPNNDIQINAPDVSKFHAYLMQMGDEWKITDAGSSFGTYVRGGQIQKDERIDLNSGDEVKLGSVEMHFYDPGGFYDYLKSPG